MKITGTFLVVEDGKAVYKTYEKEGRDYACLLELADEVLKLGVPVFRERLADHMLHEEINLNDLISEEITEKKCWDFFTQKKIERFYIPAGVATELVAELEEGKDESTTFRQFSDTLQHVLASEIINKITGWLRDMYKYTIDRDKDDFYEEKLMETNVAFCKEFYPSGFYSVTFKYGDLTLKHSSNHNFGYMSYSRLYTEFMDKELLQEIHETSEKLKIELIEYEHYSIGRAKKIIKSYLADPVSFKKEFYKNNIKLLKKVRKLEKKKIKLIENEIIPKLKRKIGKVKKENDRTDDEKKEQLKELKSKLKKYIKGKPGRIKDFYEVARSIPERKKRIELLEEEIDELIMLSS